MIFGRVPGNHHAARNTEPLHAGRGFMDTPMVNGTVYPYMEVEPRAYRFRILNAGNDRL